MRKVLNDPYRLTVLAGFLVATFGIVLQILGGWNYPVVPPGALIQLAGGLVVLLAFRWSPVVSVLAGAFILFGFVTSGDLVNLVTAHNILVLTGKWLQLITILIATPAAVISIVRGIRGRGGPAGATA